MSFDPSTLLRDLDKTKLEALVEAMYLAADADGEFSDEERDRLAQSIQPLARKWRSEPELTAAELAELIDQARAALGAADRVERLAAVKQRLGGAEACKAALGLAIEVTAADGIVRTSERELILDMAVALGVDRDEAADLVRDITRR